MTEGRADTEQEESSLSKSSIAAMLRKNSQQFKESRMTRIKGRGDQFQLRLEKMSTRTHLSRQRGVTNNH